MQEGEGGELFQLAINFKIWRKPLLLFLGGRRGKTKNVHGHIAVVLFVALNGSEG